MRRRPTWQMLQNMRSGKWSVRITGLSTWILPPVKQSIKLIRPTGVCAAFLRPPLLHGLAPGITYTRSKLHLLGIHDNDVSSLKVNRGYQVLLYDGDYLTGVSQVYNADNACLTSTSFNDMTSSVYVKEIMPPPAKPSNMLATGHSGLQLSPNPVHNEVRLISKDNLSGAVIQVYDVMGRKVLTATNTNNRINVSGLTPGVYSLTIISKGKVITSRFVK